MATVVASLVIDRGLVQSGTTATVCTQEEAEDAVGAMAADTQTIDVTYTDGTPSLTWDVRRQMSITADASGLKLSGDSATPGNSQYYGTDSGGTKGFHSLPAGSSYTDEEAQDAVGGILSDSSTIDFTYNDASNTITAIVIDASLSTAKYANQSVTYAKIQNVSATSRILGRKTAGAGSVEECTLSEILDFVGSAARGDILVRGAAGWQRVAMSGSGNDFLRSWTGAAGEPYWSPIYSSNIENGLATSVAGRAANSTGVLGDIQALSDEQLLIRRSSALGFADVRASQAEMEAASSTTAYVTAGRAKYHPGVCKGWVTFDGTGTPAAAASHNYTSITDNGTGDYTINWDVDFSAHTYVALCSATAAGPTGTAAFPCLDNTATGSTRVYYGTVDGAGTYQAADRNEICVAVFGDQ